MPTISRSSSSGSANPYHGGSNSVLWGDSGIPPWSAPTPIYTSPPLSRFSGLAALPGPPTFNLSGSPRSSSPPSSNVKPTSNPSSNPSISGNGNNKGSHSSSRNPTASDKVLMGDPGIPPWSAPTPTYTKGTPSSSLIPPTSRPIPRALALALNIDVGADSSSSSSSNTELIFPWWPGFTYPPGWPPLTTVSGDASPTMTGVVSSSATVDGGSSVSMSSDTRVPDNIISRSTSTTTFVVTITTSPLPSFPSSSPSSSTSSSSFSSSDTRIPDDIIVITPTTSSSSSSSSVIESFPLPSPSTFSTSTTRTRIPDGKLDVSLLPKLKTRPCVPVSAKAKRTAVPGEEEEVLDLGIDERDEECVAEADDAEVIEEIKNENEKRDVLDYLCGSANTDEADNNDGREEKRGQAFRLPNCPFAGKAYIEPAVTVVSSDYVASASPKPSTPDLDPSVQGSADVKHEKAEKSKPEALKGDKKKESGHAAGSHHGSSSSRDSPKETTTGAATGKGADEDEGHCPMTPPDKGENGHEKSRKNEKAHKSLGVHEKDGSENSERDQAFRVSPCPFASTSPPPPPPPPYLSVITSTAPNGSRSTITVTVTATVTRVRRERGCGVDENGVEKREFREEKWTPLPNVDLPAVGGVEETWTPGPTPIETGGLGYHFRAVHWGASHASPSSILPLSSETLVQTSTNKGSKHSVEDIGGILPTNLTQGARNTSAEPDCIVVFAFFLGMVFFGVARRLSVALRCEKKGKGLRNQWKAMAAEVVEDEEVKGEVVNEKEKLIEV
ncbi:hypothetical protein K402DRAFT_388408 [Aulographum hederae CBS 113979]|uniref:Uncharacterized protein n=1 Tax=Aulographum hederae CBS 113979 TaxID=1176131 RepID=A0A6G1HFR0_9PEZI|nr:hypothetical protein K402DRAFT_388408 [Aulographum hederae CBS 113979]